MTKVKALGFGFVVGLLGIVLSFSQTAKHFEEDLGLDLLFTLRGITTPSPEAVVVSIDRDSSESLGLPDNPDKWPRSVHAKLVDRLVAAGAKAITFDVHFIEPKVPEDDRLFTEAIRRAGNVILADAMRSKDIPISSDGSGPGETTNIVKLTKPYEPFATAAIGTAPFVLPRIPFKVNQYWTFQQGAGDAPTFPIVSLQEYGRDAFGQLVQLVRQANPASAGTLPIDVEHERLERGLVGMMRDLRDRFEADPALAPQVRQVLEQSDIRQTDPQRYRLLKALINVYAGEPTRYVNYYGPPGTVPTVHYDQALKIGLPDGPNVDVKGKVVFVGLSEVLLAERKDSFYTVFSKANGVFIGGVEIAATALLNILDEKTVQPLSLLPHLTLVLLWGIAIGVVSRLLPITIAAATSLGLGGLYLALASYQFQSQQSWFPLVVPLLMQMPFGFGTAVLWNYMETDKERKNIRKAFGLYLPNDVVDQLAKDIANLKGTTQVVYGTCLFTDAGDYTTLSEKMAPKELSDFLGRYFEALFQPVRKHDGLIVDLKGDSILAIWKGPQDDPVLRKKACIAALEMSESVARFNQSVAPYSLPTRIGLHAGQFTIGAVGAVDHFEYRPTGDVVNTASRVEGFNKYVGTQIAVSEEVIRGLDGLLTRDLGAFRLKGKGKPLGLHELVSRAEPIDQAQREACAIFAEGLAAFRSRSWDHAQATFKQCIDFTGKDGPSQFYLTLCDQYLKTPPTEEPWDAVVTLEKK
ncbi:MAG TPA: adenylate/guanylate cyclase domain-containing protein [Nitrospira sp.]|nr:adenylate/guanylate cyclase domain-containing protein [Nitrospira sp.]